MAIHIFLCEQLCGKDRWFPDRDLLGECTSVSVPDCDRMISRSEVAELRLGLIGKGVKSIFIRFCSSSSLQLQGPGGTTMAIDISNFYVQES